MAAHALSKLWAKIEPKPLLVQGNGPRIEITVSAAEPDLLDIGVELEQYEPTEVPSGSGDLWARVCVSSAWESGTLQTL